MTHPPCGRALLFLGVAVAAVALFLGLAAGPASAGPDVSAGKPPGQSGDPGPKGSTGSNAKKQSGEGAKRGSAARPGRKAARTPHAAKAPASRHGGKHPGGSKASSSQHEETDDGAHARAGSPHQDKPVAADPLPTAPVAPTTTAPLRNPDRDIRALSSGAAGISTTFASAGAGTAGSAGSAAPATEPTDVPPAPPDAVGGARNPPLLGAGPAPSRWAPFVPALDEPAFPALLLAALAVFLALFGRGDRRDPKLVEAVVDDRTEDVDFS